MNAAGFIDTIMRVFAFEAGDAILYIVTDLYTTLLQMPISSEKSSEVLRP
jgi:hypothetical protein